MPNIRWTKCKGILYTQRAEARGLWEAWRTQQNDGSYTVVFVSGDTTFQSIVATKRESVKWVRRQIEFTQHLRWVHSTQCQDADDLLLEWGRNSIPVDYVLHPNAQECHMEIVAHVLRQCADSLNPIDLGVIRHVEYDDDYFPLFLVGQKGKTYILPISPFVSGDQLQAAVRRYHVEGLKHVHRPN